jgi:hypothetical protein
MVRKSDWVEFFSVSSFMLATNGLRLCEGGDFHHKISIEELHLNLLLRQSDTKLSYEALHPPLRQIEDST